MSRFYKLCVAIVLSLTLLVSNSQVKAQDAAAGGAPAAAAAAPAGGGDAEKGKSLFTNNCAQCHAVTDEKVVGPGLKGIEEPRTK